MQAAAKKKKEQKYALVNRRAYNFGNINNNLNANDDIFLQHQKLKHDMKALSMYTTRKIKLENKKLINCCWKRKICICLHTYVSKRNKRAQVGSKKNVRFRFRTKDTDT